MTELNQIYKCEVCGNIVNILHTGAGTLVCCNQDMKLLNENTIDAATEKHIPLIKETEKGVLVFVGEIEHPMTEEHFIEWIEIITKTKTYLKRLNPLDKPQAIFNLKKDDIVSVRAYCNLHGLWKNQ